jgi:hypothetical protein
MSQLDLLQRGEEAAEDLLPQRLPSPGKATLTSRLAGGRGESTPDTSSIEDAGSEGRALSFLAQGSGGGGAPLPSAASATLQQSYGADLSSVRVHTDEHADTAARGMNAEAFAAGEHIYFAGGAYAPDSDHGSFVLAHEVAHVVQGRGNAPEAHAFHAGDDESAPAEIDADRAATAALSGRKANIQRSNGGIRCFGAGKVKRTVDADGNSHFKVEPGGHAYLTTEALKEMGLSENEAVMGYQGNWMRDLSQAGVPGLIDKLKADNLFAILNIMSIQEFGRGFDEKEFGTYDPVEHMDNPGDLRASDVYKQTDASSGAMPVKNGQLVNPDGTPNPNAEIPIANVEGLKNLGSKSGSEHEGYGKDGIDPRYANTNAKMQAKGDVMVNSGDQKAFQINHKGMPTYMNTSVEWARTTLHNSARLGKNDPRGPREFGSGIHAIQDYYAHSNFCEIAINIEISAGNVALTDEHGKTTKVSGDKKLNTHLHPNDAKGEPLKNVNLRVKDLPGFDKLTGEAKAKAEKEGNREVLTTGTFNLTDTAVSILHVAKEKLLDVNPFKEKGKGPSPLVNAALDYLDMTSPDKFNKTGKKIADMIRPVGDAIKKIGDTAAKPVDGASSAAGWGFDRMNDVNAFFGGDADYWDSTKKSVTGSIDSTAQGIRDVTGLLSKKADEMENKEHVLRDVYGWWKSLDFLAPIKAAARAIPIVGEKVAKLIEDLEKKIREFIQEQLDSAWESAVTTACAKIQGIIDWLTSKTNLKDKKKAGKAPTDGPKLPGVAGKIEQWVKETQASVERTLGGVGDLYDENGQPTEGIAPQGMTPPSHSEVAKDHHSKGVAGGESEHEHEGHEHEGEEHDHIEEDSEHGEGAHAHASDWMNSLAETLAGAASKKIGAKVKSAWDVIETGVPAPGAMDAALGDLDKEIDAWMAHPQDCREKWIGEVQRFLMNPKFATRLLKELGYIDK